jgi:hypothetical protein
MNEHDERDERPTERTEPAERTEPVAQPEPTPTLDFFGASAPSTLPVPSAPAPAPQAPTPTAPTATPAPSAVAVAADRPQRVRRGVRIRTVVFGVVMLVISGASLVALLTPVHVDGGIIGLSLLIGAGAALLVGGLTAAVRDVRRGGTRFS